MNTNALIEHEYSESRIREFVRTAFAAAGLMMLSAWVKVPLPFTPVPITLQTLMMFLVGSLMAPAPATAGMVVYVLAGFVGAPVFAVSFGPTFGYLLGFIAVPYFIARYKNHLWVFPVALLIVYGAGVLWLALWLRVRLGYAFLIGVVPFLPGDIFKMIVAHEIMKRVRSTQA